MDALHTPGVVPRADAYAFLRPRDRLLGVVADLCWCLLLGLSLIEPLAELRAGGKLADLGAIVNLMMLFPAMAGAWLPVRLIPVWKAMALAMAVGLTEARAKSLRRGAGLVVLRTAIPALVATLVLTVALANYRSERGTAGLGEAVLPGVVSVLIQILTVVVTTAAVGRVAARCGGRRVPLLAALILTPIVVGFIVAGALSTPDAATGNPAMDGILRNGVRWICGLVLFVGTVRNLTDLRRALREARVREGEG